MSQWSVLVPMVISILAVSADDQPNIKAYLLKLNEQVKIIAEQAEVIQEYKNSSIAVGGGGGAALEKVIEEQKNATAALEREVEMYKNTTAQLEKDLEEYKNSAAAETENLRDQLANLTTSMATASGRGSKDLFFFPHDHKQNRPGSDSIFHVQTKALCPQGHPILFAKMGIFRPTLPLCPLVVGQKNSSMELAVI